VISLPRRGENIYKRKDGRWEGRILRDRTDAHKARYIYVYGRTYREVKQKIDNCLDHEDERDSDEQATGLAFSVFVWQWLESKRYTVKESTYSHYRDIIERYVLPEIGNRPISQLDDVSIRQYLDKLLNNGCGKQNAGLSAKTVSDVLILLKAVFRFAEEDGWKPGLRYRDLRIRQPHKEMRVLSVREQNRLSSLFDAPLDKRTIGVMLSLYTGLRLGEVCALKWQDIDLDQKIICVRSTMQRIRDYEKSGRKTKIIISEPKSACSIRSIPVQEFLIHHLESIRAEPGAFVLTGRPDKYVEPRSMENYFRGCVEKCGIAPTNYHALRHTFATRCVEAGFDIKSLSEILGHANVSITLDRYVHSSFEQKRKNMDKLTMRY